MGFLVLRVELSQRIWKLVSIITELNMEFQCAGLDLDS